MGRSSLYIDFLNDKLDYFNHRYDIDVILKMRYLKKYSIVNQKMSRKKKKLFSRCFIVRINLNSTLSTGILFILLKIITINLGNYTEFKKKKNSSRLGKFPNFIL